MRPGACGLLLFGAAFAAAQTLPLRLTDPVTELSRKIERGQVQLAFDRVTGYLPAVLKALDIPVESQMAVFSKTSVQAMRIDPANPRVLFFNDAVIVGWVRGGFVELASQDPRLGMIFYHLDQRPSAHRARMVAATPESPFDRREDCLHCHMTPVTLGIPGVLFRSVFPSPSGVPLPRAPQYDTDDRVPFEKLWGGWYVTGNSGPATHMGNRIATDPAHPEAMLQGPSVPLDSLDAKCGPETRLTRYSDIAALMVFEHQVHMMNLLTSANRESRIALAAGRAPKLDELVDYMLFVDEAPIAGKITGTSGFAEGFSARGPRDAKGRSLYELSLEGRLMRYPCSYMIYSEAFDALPAEAKTAIYRRMWQVIAHRNAADRTAIVEILRDTKKDFPPSAP